MKVHHTINLPRRRLMQAMGAAAAVGSLPIGLHAAASDKVKIGMIGSGNVGSALGSVWAKAGHEVMFSSRTLEHDKALAAKLGGNVSAGTPREAAVFGDVVVLSVPYRALPELSKNLAAIVKGKVVIDTCNAFPARDGDIAGEAHEKGIGLMTAQLFPGARIVRAFNAVPAASMAVAHEQPGRIGMPIAGDDEKAIDVASDLIREIGFEPVLIGGLAMGKHLMPGAPLAGEHSPEEVRKIAKSL